MALETLFRLGQTVYQGMNELCWLFTEVTLGDLFPSYGYDLPAFFEIASDFTIFEVLAGGVLSVSVGIILFSLIKWVADIVL